MDIIRKRKGILILSVALLFLIIICSILFFTHRKPEAKEFVLAKKEINCIKIAEHTKTYTITNEEKIKEFLEFFDNVSVRERSTYEEIKSKFLIFGDKNKSYKISCYSDKAGKEVIYENWYVTEKEEKKEYITFDKNNYQLISKKSIMDEISELVSYCIVPLPEFNIGNVYEVSSTGYDTDIMTEEAYQMYEELLNAVPIKEKDFSVSDKYIVITTYDNEEITIYYTEEDIYVKYIKKGMGFSQKEKNTVCYFKSEA